MIPNYIHYIWLGGEKPRPVIANLDRWARLNPEYQLCEWNEQNLDLSGETYALEALKERRYAFASDVARLQVLHSVGGIYLDVDVELLRPLREMPLNGNHLTIGYMYEYALGTAFIASPPKHPVVRSLLKEYASIRQGCRPVNNTIFTDFFVNEVRGFRLDGRAWTDPEQGISIHSKDVFEQPSLGARGCSIHHCVGSWRSSRVAFSPVGSRRLALFATLLRHRYAMWRGFFRSEYRDVYLISRFTQRRVRIHSAWKLG